MAPRAASNKEASKYRWLNNYILGGLNTVLGRLILPFSAISAALLANEKNWGILHNIELSHWTEVILAFLIIDLAGYFLHRVLHAVPVLWKLHVVHHSDICVDVSTSVRHHPVEIMLATTIIVAIILLLGAPLFSVLLYELLFIIVAIFSHANIKLPKSVEKVLRYIVITPDFHKIHHSLIKAETNSNYGNLLTWWDFIFSTYIPSPKSHQYSMLLGLEYFRSNRDQIIDRLLMQPFRKAK